MMSEVPIGILLPDRDAKSKRTLMRWAPMRLLECIVGGPAGRQTRTPPSALANTLASTESPMMPADAALMTKSIPPVTVA